jgi:GTP-binding protein Era
MTDAALVAAEDADVRVILFESIADWDTPEERLSQLAPPLVLLRTKRDLGAPTPVPEAKRFTEILEVSAERAEGLGLLVDRIVSYLPEAPPLYPEDSLTDRPVRFLAAEQIREVAFEVFRDEIPYALAVEVEEWKEDEAEVRVRANVLVERESQKGIVVGAGGRMLRDLGTEARRRLGERLKKTVHLKLWVKTDRNWTKRLRRVRELGYL